MELSIVTVHFTKKYWFNGRHCSPPTTPPPTPLAKKIEIMMPELNYERAPKDKHIIPFLVRINIPVQYSICY